MNKITVLKRTCLFCFAIQIFLTGCGGESDSGGKGQPGTTSTPTTISGYVIKGPVTAATVTAYSIVAGQKGTSLASATTVSAGGFSLEINSNYSGVVLLEATSGTYIDEASGSSKSLSANSSYLLTSVIASITPEQNNNVLITPLTTFLVSSVQTKTSGFTANNIANAATTMQQLFGINVFNTFPINLLQANAANGVGQTSIDYALILAGISQQAQTLGLSDPMELVTALANDIKDGSFDGQLNGTTVMINSNLSLSSSAASADLATAIADFSKSSSNASGATASNSLIALLGGNVPTTIIPPDTVTATPGFNTITLSWSAVGNASSYNVYYRTSAGVTKTNSVKSSYNGLSVIFNNLSSATTYYFAVSALEGTNESALSQEVFASPKQLVLVLGSYVGQSVEVISTNCSDSTRNGSFIYSSGILKIDTQNSDSFTGNLILQGDVQGSSIISTKLLTGSVTSLGELSGTFTDTLQTNSIKISSGDGSFTGQYANNSIVLNLSGQDTVGETCLYTMDATFNAKIPVAPSNVTAVAGDANITLNWDIVPTAMSYNLYWTNTAGTTYENIVRNVLPPFTHEDRIVGLTYYYAITASNQIGESQPSAQVSAKASTTIHSKDIFLFDSNPLIPDTVIGTAFTVLTAIYRIDPTSGKQTIVSTNPYGPIALDSGGFLVDGYNRINPATAQSVRICCAVGGLSMGVVNGVAVTSSDEIYVTVMREQNFAQNHYLGRIDLVNNDYVEIAPVGTSFEPIRMTIDNNDRMILFGNLTYLSGGQVTTSRIARYDPVSQAITPFYTASLEPDLPSAIAVDTNGDYFVSYGNNDSIEKINPANGQVTIITNRGAIRQVKAMEFDAGGNLLIATDLSLVSLDLATKQITGIASGGAIFRLTSIAVVP